MSDPTAATGPDIATPPTWRRVVAVILLVLTSLSVVTATVAVWAHRTLFDTDSFMATVEPALTEPAFYVAIGDRASAEVLEALDIETRVTAALAALDDFLSQALIDALGLDERARELLERLDRPSLTVFAPSITEGLETRVDAVIHDFFVSDAFVERFPGLVERAHRASVALLRDDLAELPNVYVEAGEVRLNLIPLIAEALRGALDDLRAIIPDIDLPEAVSDRVEEGRDQLAEAIRAQLPPDFGQVTIMSEATLSELQATAVSLDRMVWLVVVLTIVLGVATIAVSPTRRRTTLYLALGVAVALVLALLLVGQLQAAVLAQITNPNAAQAIQAVLAELVARLRSLQVGVAIVAVLAGLIAWLVGRSPRSVTGDGGTSGATGTHGAEDGRQEAH
jgi:hypothetical protein